jgi:rhodanese-related sulfurtransferase
MMPRVQINEQQIIDVRSPAEFSSGHRPGAVNIPLEEMRQRAGSRYFCESLFWASQLKQAAKSTRLLYQGLALLSLKILET